MCGLRFRAAAIAFHDAKMSAAIDRATGGTATAAAATAAAVSDAGAEAAAAVTGGDGFLSALGDVDLTLFTDDEMLGVLNPDGFVGGMPRPDAVNQYSGKQAAPVAGLAPGGLPAGDSFSVVSSGSGSGTFGREF